MMDEFFERVAANGVALCMLPLAVFLVFTLHEAGHYAAARLFGVRVLSFTIGLGPRLRQWTDRRGALWTVNLVPLCGMVRLAGQEGSAGASAAPDQYNARPVWQRAVIVAAGPAVNIMLAFVFIGAFYIAAGVPAARPEVVGVEAGSPADHAGLMPGDVITHINGAAITRFAQVRQASNAHVGEELALTVRRNAEMHEFTVIPEMAEYKTIEGFGRAHGRMGILSPEKSLRLSVVHSVGDVDTKGDIEKARAALARSGGDDITLALDSADITTKMYRARVSMESLKDMEEGNSFHFGTWPAVFYDRQSPLAAAMRDTARLVRGTINIAAQMFPADAAQFRPEVRPVREQSPVRHDLFIVLYIGALWSVFTAFFNLLPVPRLDGGVLLMLAVEGLYGAERAQTLAPYVARGGVLLFLAVLAFMNAGDFMQVMNIR